MKDIRRKIRKEMNVVASDGVDVGVVDRMEGDRIKVTRYDGAGQGPEALRGYVPMTCVANVSRNKVVLSVTAGYVRRASEAPGQTV